MAKGEIAQNPPVTMALMRDVTSSKINLWQSFFASNRIDEESVLLFSDAVDEQAFGSVGA
jgi:hypothetical protein